MKDSAKSLLVKLIGFPATLVHGDTLVLDRWLWLRTRLGRGAGKKLLDVGCGTGAFTIGAALRGYRALGLSWDTRNQNVARHRAALSGAENASFEVVDVRRLDERTELYDQFDVAICLETVEHILDDAKVFRDVARTLAPGGRLLLTTPNLNYRAITAGDNGPFSTYEDGWHVRKGYDEARIRQLATDAGFTVEEVSWCSGFISQKVTWAMRTLGAVNQYFAWAATLPLRILPPLLDPVVSRLSRWPAYSICLSATKTGAVPSPEGTGARSYNERSMA